MTVKKLFNLHLLVQIIFNIFFAIKRGKVNLRFSMDTIILVSLLSRRLLDVVLT